MMMRCFVGKRFVQRVRTDVHCVVCRVVRVHE